MLFSVVDTFRYFFFTFFFLLNKIVDDNSHGNPILISRGVRCSNTSNDIVDYGFLQCTTPVYFDNTMSTSHYKGSPSTKRAIFENIINRNSISFLKETKNILIDIQY